MENLRGVLSHRRFVYCINVCILPSTAFCAVLYNGAWGSRFGLKVPWHAVFGCLYIGLSGPLILYLKSLSRNSALVQNYSHYEQSHNELSSGHAVSVSVALNTMRKKEAGLTAILRSFANHDVSRKNQC